MKEHGYYRGDEMDEDKHRDLYGLLPSDLCVYYLLATLQKPELL